MKVYVQVYGISMYLYMYIHVCQCQCPCPCLCTVLVSIHSQSAIGGKGRLVDRPQFPLIPQRLDMIHQLSPPVEVETKGSRGFGQKKFRFTKRSQFGPQKPIPWQPWLLIHLETKRLTCRFSVPEVRAMMAASRVATAMRWRPTSLRFGLLETKTTVLQCGDWNLIPFFSCLICGIFLVFNSLPWNQQVAPNIDDFEDDHSLPPQFAGGFSLFVSGRQLPNNSTLMDFLIDFLRLKLELFWSQLSFGVCWRDVGNAWWFQGPQDVYGHMVLPTLKMMKLWAQTLKGWKPIEHQALKSWVCFHCGYRMPMLPNLQSPYVHDC